MRYVAAARIEPAPPPLSAGWARSLRKLFFGSFGSALTTALLLLVCGRLAWALYTWGIRDAVFSGVGAPLTCRAAQAGACWAVIGEKLRLILFGAYPYAQQWRPGDRGIAARRHVRTLGAAAVVELAARRGVAAGARRLRAADVRRRARPARPCPTTSGAACR